MDSLNCLRHNEDVIAQASGAELVLFHMDSGNYFSLNELGARIWELCDGQRPLTEVAELLETEYSAPRELILKDCRTLIEGLLENGLLVSRDAQYGTCA